MQGRKTVKPSITGDSPLHEITALNSYYMPFIKLSKMTNN